MCWILGSWIKHTKYFISKIKIYIDKWFKIKNLNYCFTKCWNMYTDMTVDKGSEQLPNLKDCLAIWTESCSNQNEAWAGALWACLAEPQGRKHARPPEEMRSALRDKLSSSSHLLRPDAGLCPFLLQLLHLFPSLKTGFPAVPGLWHSDFMWPLHSGPQN